MPEANDNNRIWEAIRSLEFRLNTHRHTDTDLTSTLDVGDDLHVVHTLISAATAANYGVIFTALRPCILASAVESHTAAGNDAGAVTLQLEKLTSGEALDAGDTILSTAWNLKSTANTPVTKTAPDFNTTARQLTAGDRIALKDVGTLTNLAGIQVTLYFNYL